MKKNVFKDYNPLSKEEIFETLFKNDEILIERIVSYGNISPDDQWYDQEKDEWVVLLDGNAKLEFQDHKIVELTKGEFIHIPAHYKHKVIYTSIEPICIWLAFHFKST